MANIKTLCHLTQISSKTPWISISRPNRAAKFFRKVNRSRSVAALTLTSCIWTSISTNSQRLKSIKAREQSIELRQTPMKSTLSKALAERFVKNFSRTIRMLHRSPKTRRCRHKEVIWTLTHMLTSLKTRPRSQGWSGWRSATPSRLRSKRILKHVVINLRLSTVIQLAMLTVMLSMPNPSAASSGSYQKQTRFIRRRQ